MRIKFLFFEVPSVLHAQRAETLTHYQLIREWRRERMCKGCEKSHQGVVPGYKGTSSAGARWLGNIYDKNYAV